MIVASTPTPTPVSTVPYFQLDLSRSIRMPTIASEFRMLNRYTQDTPPYYTFESGEAVITDVNATVLSWDPESGELGFSGKTTEILKRPELYPIHPDNGLKFANYFRTTSGHATLYDFNSQITARFGPYSNPKYIFSAIFEESSSYFENPARAKVSSSTYKTFMIGTTTVPGELPTTGTVRFNTSWNARLVSQHRVMPIGWTSQPVNVDFAARTVRGNILAEQTAYITGTEPLKIQLALEASYDPSTGRISGTLRNADGAFSGRVLGYFYGPFAAELGLAMQMTWDNGKQPIAGSLVGWR